MHLTSRVSLGGRPVPFSLSPAAARQIIYWQALSCVLADAEPFSKPC